MDLLQELRLLRDKGVTQIKDLSLAPYLEGLNKLETDTATKEEVQTLYLQGFTSGELLGLSTAYNSRQALFSMLTKRHANYKEVNKEKRLGLEQALAYYYGFILVEQGHMEEINRFFGGNKSRIIKYYISQGGQQDLWEERVYTDGMYVNVIPFLTGAKTIRKVAEELSQKPESDLTEDERYFLSMSEAQYNSLQACYGRIKKIEIMNAIYQNKTKEEINQEHFVLDNTYKTYYTNAIKKVKQLYNKYKTEPNPVQRIKYELRVTGQGSNDFINQVIGS